MCIDKKFDKNGFTQKVLYFKDKTGVIGTEEQMYGHEEYKHGIVELPNDYNFIPAFVCDTCSCQSSNNNGKYKLRFF